MVNSYFVMLTLSLTFACSVDVLIHFVECKEEKWAEPKINMRSLLAVCSIRQKEEKIYKYVPCFTYKLVRFKNCFRS